MIIDNEGKCLKLCTRWRGLINRADGENGEVIGKVLWYHFQSRYYHAVSDQRAQFNEAVHLVFSHTSSPNASPPFLCHPTLSLSLSSSLFSLSSLSLCVYLPFPYHFTSFFHISTSLFGLLSPSSQPASHLSVFLSPPGGLSHGGRYSKRRFRL